MEKHFALARGVGSVFSMDRTKMAQVVTEAWRIWQARGIVARPSGALWRLERRSGGI
jgi:hypothetical protein